MKNIMKTAWQIYKNAGCKTRAEFSLALKMAWEIAKNNTPKQVVIATFDQYNQRRYGTPWAAKLENGKYEFGAGTYSADYNYGDAGDLYINRPINNTIYAYGQKDHRGGKTMLQFAIYKNGKFIECDKLGRVVA